MLLACAVGRRIRTALWPREEQEAMIDTVVRIVASGEASLREHIRVQVGCTRGAGRPPPFAQRGDRGRRHKREPNYYTHLSHATCSPQSPNLSHPSTRAHSVMRSTSHCVRRIRTRPSKARHLRGERSRSCANLRAAAWINSGVFAGGGDGTLSTCWNQ